MNNTSNVSWLDDYKRKHPALGTIEHKDQHGKVIQTIEGILVGRGATKKVVEPQEVYDLATLYCTYKEIADFLDMPVETLKYNFRDLITKGYQATKQKLRSKQIQVACEGNVTMLIWLGKNILNQSDQPSDTESNQVLPWTEEETKED